MVQQGFYRDPPSRRMAYDADGSILGRVTGGNVYLDSSATAAQFNKEGYSEMFGGRFAESGARFILFPELRDVTHGYRNMTSGTYAVGSAYSNWEVSSNTTTGLDGDWTVSNGFTAVIESTTPNFRTNMGVVGATAVKGIRWYYSGGGAFSGHYYAQWHLYGHKAAGQTPHRIDFCDSAGDELLLDEDYGDQPRNSDRLWSPTNTWNQGSALYIKNRSGTKQAKSITITYEVVASSNDSASHYKLSKDNVTFGTSVAFTQLNPQQMAGPIYVLHSPPLGANLGVKAGRLRLNVGEWL